MTFIEGVKFILKVVQQVFINMRETSEEYVRQPEVTIHPDGKIDIHAPEGITITKARSE